MFLPSIQLKAQAQPIHQVDNVKVRSDSLVVQVLVKDPGQGGGEVKVNPGACVENGKIPFDWWWCQNLTPDPAQCDNRTFETFCSSSSSTNDL